MESLSIHPASGIYPSSTINGSGMFNKFSLGIGIMRYYDYAHKGSMFLNLLSKGSYETYNSNKKAIDNSGRKKVVKVINGGNVDEIIEYIKDNPQLNFTFDFSLIKLFVDKEADFATLKNIGELAQTRYVSKISITSKDGESLNKAVKYINKSKIYKDLDEFMRNVNS